MNGLDAHAGTAIATMAGADAVAGVFLAMAPFVEGVVLATHGGKSNVNLVGDMKIGVGFFVVFLRLQEYCRCVGFFRAHLDITSCEDGGVVLWMEPWNAQ